MKAMKMVVLTPVSDGQWSMSDGRWKWWMSKISGGNVENERGDQTPLPTTITGLNIMVGITMNGKLSQ